MLTIKEPFIFFRSESGTFFTEYNSLNLGLTGEKRAALKGDFPPPIPLFSSVLYQRDSLNSLTTRIYFAHYPTELGTRQFLASRQATT